MCLGLVSLIHICSARKARISMELKKSLRSLDDEVFLASYSFCKAIPNIFVDILVSIKGGQSCVYEKVLVELCAVQAMEIETAPSLLPGISFFCSVAVVVTFHSRLLLWPRHLFSSETVSTPQEMLPDIVVGCPFIECQGSAAMVGGKIASLRMGTMTPPRSTGAMPPYSRHSLAS